MCRIYPPSMPNGMEGTSSYFQFTHYLTAALSLWSKVHMYVSDRALCTVVETMHTNGTSSRGKDNLQQITIEMTKDTKDIQLKSSNDELFTIKAPFLVARQHWYSCPRYPCFFLLLSWSAGRIHQDPLV